MTSLVSPYVPSRSRRSVSFVRVLGAALLIAAPFAVGCGSSDVNQPAQYPSDDAPVGFDGPSPSVAASDPTGVQQPIPEGELGPDGRPIPPGQLGENNVPGVGGELPDNEQLSPDQYGDTDPSALSDFREALNPYGQWVEDPNYGTIWVPSSDVVGSDFTPYQTAGQWGYDNEQYTWMSDYSWGWAPFHYGRWAYTGGYGWGWIPGRTYAGAWVNWRTGGPGYGYVGWAPLGPTWGWRNGAAVGFGFATRAPYTFCPTGSLFGRGMQGSVVRGPAVAGIASSTRTYTASAPSAHTVAHPTVNGPSPSALGISQAQVTRVSANPTASAQVAKAQAFSRPSTAVAAGGRAPVNGRANGAVAYSNSNNTYGRAGYSAYSSAHSAVASSPQYRGVSPSPYRSVGTSASYYGRPGVTRISGAGSYSGSAYSSAGAGYGSRGSSYSTPSYHTPFVSHTTGSTTATPTTQPMQGYNSGYTGGISHSSFGSHASGGGGHSGGGGGHGHR